MKDISLMTATFFLLLTMLSLIVQAEEVDAAGGSAMESAGISGEMIFAARCSLCHQLPEADMLNVKQWGFIIETMQQRMLQANMPQLIDDEKKTLLEYLGEHARK